LRVSHDILWLQPTSVQSNVTTGRTPSCLVTSCDGECIRRLRALARHIRPRYNTPAQLPSKMSLPVGDLDLIQLIHCLLDQLELAPSKRHLDRFSHLCTADQCTQHTDTHTETAR